MVRKKGYEDIVVGAQRFLDRSMVLDMLRDKYQLRVSDCIGVPSSVIEERRKKYLEHRARLEAHWKQEDLDHEKK